MRPQQNVGEIIVEDKALRDFVQMPLVVVLDDSLTAGAKVAYGLLLWYEWRGIGFPGQDMMGKHLGTSERSVRNYLRDLIEHGYLEVKQHGLGRPNTYIIKSLQRRSDLDRQKVAGLVSSNLPVKPERNFRSLERLDSTNKNNNEDEASLSWLSELVSARLNDRQQQRSILGFLEGRDGDPGFTPAMAQEALQRTVDRHASDPLDRPIAFFYTMCQILRDKVKAEAEAVAGDRQRRLTLARSVAQLSLTNSSDLEMARSAVAEYWPDLADEVIMELSGNADPQ